MLEEVWTKDALQDAEEILDYLVVHWNQKIIQRFYSDLNNAISQIKQKPNNYKIVGKDLIILRLYPNRKDPEGLLFRDR